MGMIKIPTLAIKKFEDNYPKIFATGNLAEGMWNNSLSEFFVKYTNCQSAIPFSSNGSGLLAILVLLKRYYGYRKIFIQANTMYGVKTIAITSGLDYLGAVPCSIPTLMPTLSQLIDFVDSIENPNECVFLLSHIGGIINPEISTIAEYCKRKGIALVEDCAHSLGATIGNKHSGLFGVAGVYSLYATKAIAAGEGGIVVTNDDSFGKLLSKFIIYDRFDQKLDVGVNFRVSELQALFSLCVCELSEDIIQNKAQIADRYIEVCEEAGVKYVDPYQNGQRGNHYKFTLIAECDANTEFKTVSNRTSPVYDYVLGNDPMNIARRHICLPIWYGLEDDIVASTVTQLRQL